VSRRRAAASAAFLAGLLCMTSAAHAQSGPLGRVEISFTAGWTGSTGLDADDATETRPGGGTLQLFGVDASLQQSITYGPRVDVRLTNVLHLEGGGSIGRGGLQVEITDDFELADDITISEDVKQLLIDGGLLVQFRGSRAGARTLPFVTAGGGFFWDVHEGDTVSETGQLFYAGAGIKHAFLLRTQPRASLKALGIRLEGRLIMRTGGAATDDNVHALPALSASLFVRF
jgi:hypothetical protein